MLLGACFAGLAIENSMLGATHALANPLTAQFGIIHGQAIATMLPHVIRFNGHTVPTLYEELSEIANDNGQSQIRPGADELAQFVSSLVEKAKLPQLLADQGVQREMLPDLASQAAQQWTAEFNPRDVGHEELLELYQSAFD